MFKKDSLSLYQWLVIFCVILTACQSSHTPIPTLFTQNKMTIDYRILIGHPLTAEQKNTIQTIINKTFAEIDAIYNKWNPQSELSQLNQLAAYEQKILSPQLFQLLLRIDTLVNLSEGLFDPTVEPLQQLWKMKLNQGGEPSQEDINILKPCLGWNKIHFKEGIFFKEDSRTHLDLGGIAKGLCVDLLVERLNQAGFQNVFVEWGGEIRTSGEHPDHRPWNIYISRFGDPLPQHALTYLSLNNQAVATSGDYFQFWTIQTKEGKTKTYTHIFNPLTYAPILVQPGSIASASLIANDCLTADGLAKVAMLFNSMEEVNSWIEKVGQTMPDLIFWIASRESPSPYRIVAASSSSIHSPQ